MRNIINQLLADEAGFVLSAELVLVGTISVIGLVAGMSQVRGALLEEYDDIAESLSSLDQSYQYSGFRGCKSMTAGSAYFEDGREVEVDFTEVYRGNGCVEKRACLPKREVIVEPLPCPQETAPCNDCLEAPRIETGCPPQQIEPLASPCNSCGTSPCGNPCQQAIAGGCLSGQNFVPAPVYRGIGAYGQSYAGVDGNPQKMVMPYQNSVYNVKRYIDTPIDPLTPHLAPRSSVW